MRVDFSTEGGIAYFPGLAAPTTIDTDDLSPEEALELKQLVEAARFFDLPSNASASAPGGADQQHYVVTVEEAGRRHQVRVSIPVEDPALRALLDHLAAKAKERRAALRRQGGEHDAPPSS